jgi:hypothetical protein
MHRPAFSLATQNRRCCEVVNLGKKSGINVIKDAAMI